MIKHKGIYIASAIVGARLLGFQSLSFVIPLLVLLGVYYKKEDKAVWGGLIASEIMLFPSPISLFTLPLFYLIYKGSSYTKKTIPYTIASILIYNTLTTLLFAALYMNFMFAEAMVLSIPFVLKQLVSGMVFYAMCQLMTKKLLKQVHL